MNTVNNNNKYAKYNTHVNVYSAAIMAQRLHKFTQSHDEWRLITDFDNEYVSATVVQSHTELSCTEQHVWVYLL